MPEVTPGTEASRLCLVAKFLPFGAARSLPYWEKAASAGCGSRASPGNQPVISRVMAKLQMQPENLTPDGKVERSQMPSGVTKAPAAAADLGAPSNYQGCSKRLAMGTPQDAFRLAHMGAGTLGWGCSNQPRLSPILRKPISRSRGLPTRHLEQV